MDTAAGTGVGDPLDGASSAHAPAGGRSDGGDGPFRMFLQLERGQVRWRQARPSPCTWPRPNSQATHRWHRPSTTSRRRSTRHPGEVLQVTTTFDAQGAHKARSDQVVAGMVQQGKYDLAVVPARSWDDLGVSSLRPLQTPFLVDSDDLVDEIVTGDVAGRLMSGLSGAGVHALTLWPGGCGTPSGSDKPLLTPAGLSAEPRSWAPYSQDVYAMLRALGSDPVELDGAATNAAYAAGRLQGADRGTNYPAPGPPTTMTADGTCYGEDRHARRQRRSWDRLTDEQRSVLAEARQRYARLAGRRTTPGGRGAPHPVRRRHGRHSSRPCRAAAIEHATDPLVDQMRADPELGPVIDELETLKEDVGPTPIPRLSARSRTCPRTSGRRRPCRPGRHLPDVVHGGGAARRRRPVRGKQLRALDHHP